MIIRTIRCLINQAPFAGLSNNFCRLSCLAGWSGGRGARPYKFRFLRDVAAVRAVQLTRRRRTCPGEPTGRTSGTLLPFCQCVLGSDRMAEKQEWNYPAFVDTGMGKVDSNCAGET